MLLEINTYADKVDFAFYLILGISFLFLIGLTATMVYFAIRYSRKRNPKPTQIKDNVKMEVLWIVVPTILVLLMFYYGWVAFMPMRNVPDNALNVKVISRMWEFEYEYENGKRSKVLTVPQGRPVKLNLTSEDVIHNLSIPAFRIREDCVPKKDNYLWFNPIEKGTYDIYCAEYCGLMHSSMLSKVEVVDSTEYLAWVKKIEKPVASGKGLEIMRNNACLSCHSLDGKAIIAPSFKGLYGSQISVVSNGAERTITVDDEYLKKSIIDPNADIHKGFNPNIMQSYKTVISEKDMQEIVEFMKTVK